MAGQASPETSDAADLTAPKTTDTKFTNRELSILELIAQGLTNTQIAREINLSKYTVAQHVAKMLKRIGASNRTELVSLSYTAGILASDSMTDRDIAVADSPLCSGPLFGRPWRPGTTEADRGD